MSETGDGLDHLRIPFEKIKFGRKLETQGYGTVFEGEFGDQTVALKQLNITNLANIKPKLLAEILTISRFRQHPNLVALLGFCDEKGNEITLVYEYVASGSLADKMRKRLTTIQTFEICLGAARGLDYLHTGVDSATSGLVHGNIKLSKILLNLDANSSKFEAKVSSFGLSKIVPGKAQKVLESSDEVTEKVTKESDVYSFGVLLLEVLCGVSELVDTDDYQERHVTELVPKKMVQNKLRKIVHFDIRKEIKTESLETYARIACQCVMENPESRPRMAQVVEELEKALRLQGGEVTYVQIPESRNIAGAKDEIVMENDDDTDTGVTLESHIGNEAEFDVNIPITDEDRMGLIGSDKSEDATEDKSSTLEDIINTVSVPNKNHIDDAKIEDNNNDQVTQKELPNDLNSKKDSNLNNPVENEEENKSKIPTTDPETTEENNGDFDSNKKSNITEEMDRDNQSMEISESGNADTSTSTNKEMQDSGFPKSDVTDDELEHLRFPYEKIKFGQRIDVRGYGTMFIGEFNDQQVALKRLNITNLGNIKPKLLAAILTIYRFRQHPNLVALIGFCEENRTEIILVYEYISGGNLADKMSKHLTTIQRLEICLGAARGLEYLHHGVESVDSKPGIVHGDLKLSKILLNLDSNSSKFEAKVSGFGLPKLLPGHVESSPKSKDPVHRVTGEFTKESDVYTFGVLLLEVLCGVPELVDTDDYQERHVTELVPKRLEQNILRKIVHFDIREEIKTESLETYAKIACRCVMKNPEERPSMSEVVEELEKALRLQGGKVSDVQIDGGTNGKGLTEVLVDEDDHIGDEAGETMSLNVTVEESKLTEKTIDDISLPGQSIPDPVLGSDDIGNVAEGAEKENVDEMNDPESTKDITVDLNLNETSKIIEENEVYKSSFKPDNGNGLREVAIGEDDQEGDDKGEAMGLNLTEKESNAIEVPTDDIAMEMHDSAILKSDSRNFIDANDDDLEHLLIPFEKIKFGQRIDVRGYGTMFIGELNGQQVALKQLKITNLGNIKPKLLAAILTIYRFRQHPNLVALIGFCEENNKEIILVYEYISGGNLADKMSKHLTTIQRLEICLGAARGLEYLHHGVESVDSNPSIVHGDIKLSKILLNLDSNSSKFEAKVSGFGLPKLLPGHVEISPKSKDPVHAVTGKLTKESDVYTFGVLLLEVLCGVPELVDTDDYQERHVTELVPKRLEQNMLRKIVHFDIREEITTESLETYAKIACRCVMKIPEERPTMSEVVEELEKALRLQGGKVSDVQIYGSSNGKGLHEVLVGKDDHEGDDDGETLSLNTTEEESKLSEETVDNISLLGQSIPVPVLGNDDIENVAEVAEKENVDNVNESVSTEEIAVDLSSNETSSIIEENEVNKPYSTPGNGNGLLEVPICEDDQEGEDNGEAMSSNVTEEEFKVNEEPTKDTAQEDAEKENGNKTNDSGSTEEITVDLKSNEESKVIGEDEVHNESNITTLSSKSAMQEQGFPLPDEKSEYVDAAKENGNVLMKNTQNPHMKEITGVQEPTIVDGDAKGGSMSIEKPELIVNIRGGDFSNQIQESESKRSNSTCSESSNGDGTTPSDYLLPKSPVHVKRTSQDSRSCCSCYCSCSWWGFIYDRVVFYGGQFWNKLVSCFTWATGQCSSKKD